MDMSLLNFLFEHTDNPVIVSVVLMLILVTVLLGVAKKIINFHSNDLLFRSVKNIESSLTKLDVGSDDHELFKEIMTQELFYANTKLRLSRKERLQIKEWSVNRMIPISFVRKAWPNISIEKGKLVPKVSKFDVGYSIWLLFSLMVFVIGFVGIGYFIILNAGERGISEYGLLTTCGVFTLISFRELSPILYARKIKLRLIESEHPEAEVDNKNKE